MDTNLINVVSTFAGCGGSSLGYERANCKILLAIDFEKNAVKTYKMNFPDTVVWQKNIRDVLGKDILKKIGLKKGELDIFDGSPPCTPFSMAGKRENGWNKSYQHSSESSSQRTDDLFFEYIRLINELRPKSFIGENVRGLIQGKAKGYFNIIFRKMREIGYIVKAFDINAKNFDVPQSRPRIIFIGIRNDLAPTIWPKLILKKPISFYFATKNLKIPESELTQSRKVMNWPSVNKYLPKMKQGESMSKYHPTGSFFSYVRLNMNRPSNTITTKPHSLFHPIENRGLTPSEIKRLASFPDDFQFLSFQDAWMRIGNSVPPNLMMNMANYLKSILENKMSHIITNKSC